MKKHFSKEVISWALYDWANSAFATTIMAGFFPVFFKMYWSQGAEVTLSTARLGLANSLAGIVIAIVAPFLGAVADIGNTKKKFLAFFSVLGAVCTFFLFFVPLGDWQQAVFWYLAASSGFSGALIFYDALIKSVAVDENMDGVSSLGYSLGYLGGGLLFAFNIFMLTKPELFGLADASEAVRYSFISVAVWWLIFALPLFLWVKEKKQKIEQIPVLLLLKKSFSQLIITFKEIRQVKHIFLFLVAYWLYIDGVDTIIRMAVDYGMSLKMDSKALMTALLITQFIGFPAALIFGWLGNKIGTRQGIFIALIVYLAITTWAAFMRTEFEFYLVAATVGLVQGGIQALSRSYFARMIPAEKAAEYFGFYNMLGKFATVIGPSLMGLTGLMAVALGANRAVAPRFGIISVALLFLSGGIILRKVKVD